MHELRKGGGGAKAAEQGNLQAAKHMQASSFEFRVEGASRMQEGLMRDAGLKDAGRLIEGCRVEGASRMQEG